MEQAQDKTGAAGGVSASGVGLGSFEKESYLLGLLDAKVECAAALSVMKLAYETDKIRLSGAIDAIRQAMILIDDKIAMAEAPNKI